MNVVILFFLIVIIGISAFVILFVLEFVKLDQIIYYLQAVEVDPKLKWIVGSVSGLIILLSLKITGMITGLEQKERTIAFDNPSGRVSISLNAVEDLIKKLILRMPDVQEIRPNIVASKRGIEVDARVTLKGDSNIPDLTSRLQEMVRSKIQDIIGIDEPVHVKIHVFKILAEEKRRDKKEDKESRQEFTVPFQGYKS